MTGLEAFILPALASLGSAASTAATAAAPLITAAQTIAPIAGIAGTGLSIMGQIQQNKAMQQAAKMQSEEDKSHANAEMITAAQRAEAQRKKKEYLISQQRARIGASGAGTGGTAAEIVGNTEAQGDLNSELELWQGKERADAYLKSARMKLYSANQQSKALPYQIGSSIVSGITGLSRMPGASSGGYGDTLLSSDYDSDSNWQTKTYKSGYVYG